MIKHLISESIILLFLDTPDVFKFQPFTSNAKTQIDLAVKRKTNVNCNKATELTFHVVKIIIRKVFRHGRHQEIFQGGA